MIRLRAVLPAAAAAVLRRVELQEVERAEERRVLQPEPAEPEADGVRVGHRGGATGQRVAAAAAAAAVVHVEAVDAREVRVVVKRVVVAAEDARLGVEGAVALEAESCNRPVFQLGIFPRALHPARTVLRPARLHSALPALKKKKNYYFFCFSKCICCFCVFRQGCKNAWKQRAATEAPFWNR